MMIVAFKVKKIIKFFFCSIHSNYNDGLVTQTWGMWAGQITTQPVGAFCRCRAALPFCASCGASGPCSSRADATC